MGATGGASVGVPSGAALAADVAVVKEAREFLRRIGFALLTFVGAAIVSAPLWAGVPWASQALCRHQQSEGRSNLRQLANLQSTRFNETDAYAPSLELLGFSPVGAHYRYVLRAPDARHFEAFAYRADGSADDVWRIDDSFFAEHVIDGCAK